MSLEAGIPHETVFAAPSWYVHPLILGRLRLPLLLHVGTPLLVCYVPLLFILLLLYYAVVLYWRPSLVIGAVPIAG